MDVVLLVVRIVLALVLGRAALAKLSDGVGFRAVLGGFGLPWRLAAALAKALPPIELAVGAALVVSPTARGASLAASSLLVVFTAAVLAAIASGRRPSCGCFGGGRPIGRQTLARNALLLSAALGVFFGGGSRLPIAAEATAAVMLAFGVLSLAALEGLRRRGSELLREEALAAAASDAVPTRVTIAFAALALAGTAAAQPADDLETLRTLLDRAGPQLVGSGRRAGARVKAQKASPDRTKRRAAADALAAQRTQLLDLRARVLALQLQDGRAQNARRLAAESLALFAASISRVQNATGLPPKPAFEQLLEARTLLEQAIYRGSRAGYLLQ
jgi:hypothetical protein